LERPGQRALLKDHGDGSACAERVGTTRILVAEDQLPDAVALESACAASAEPKNIVELRDISDSFVSQEVT
jgi:hypothetical protein